MDIHDVEIGLCSKVCLDLLNLRYAFIHRQLLCHQSISFLKNLGVNACGTCRLIDVVNQRNWFSKLLSEAVAIMIVAAMAH